MFLSATSSPVWRMSPAFEPKIAPSAWLSLALGGVVQRQHGIAGRGEGLLISLLREEGHSGTEASRISSGQRERNDQPAWIRRSGTRRIDLECVLRLHERVLLLLIRSGTTSAVDAPLPRRAPPPRSPPRLRLAPFPPPLFPCRLCCPRALLVRVLPPWP